MADKEDERCGGVRCRHDSNLIFIFLFCFLMLCQLLVSFIPIILGWRALRS